jgi:ribosomal protein S18 acetylase RimI-like enzyme
MPDTKYELSETRRDEFDAIMAMTRRAAVFNEIEVDTVIELLEGYEESPEESGYYFMSCREVKHATRERNEEKSKDAQAGQVIGYACWGPRELSGNGYDLYWICADPAVHSKGVGRALMSAVEEEIRKRHGVWLVIETSDTEHYAPARRLYERCGYALSMLLKDFYHDGDGLCTYIKRLR